jgi:DNA-binding MarR family transcriptional regulator
MSSVTDKAGDSRRRRRRLTVTVKESLRDANLQLSLLNHRVSAQVELKDADFGCLDLISRTGPVSPSTLARQAGLHPATLTGILDRLERAGWIARGRDADDRRAIVVQTLPDRSGEIFRHYAGMNGAMDGICADYTDAELELIGDFLHRVVEAGRGAAADLAGE